MEPSSCSRQSPARCQRHDTTPIAQGDTRMEGARQMVMPQNSGVPATGSPQRDGDQRHDTICIAQDDGCVEGAGQMDRW
ncbi:unnamed protein product [Vitrella brassicaformis CCMP3155]|uniref:Uncharacterized protein n=1 Tax=Vitrella brassicaformis (strain CCMP3155) TaxID=1169540 RepID=A0A0G4GGN8_VITBC|nr:unnamed protein product [Vitrella brassicaformis CCMP3155]|eukprot:CEM28801.1 unnamed protein product [Vitrella brassicaformis CCMP3155]